MTQKQSNKHTKIHSQRNGFSASLVSPAINFPFLPSIMLIINLVKKSAYDSGPTYCFLTVKSHLLL